LEHELVISHGNGPQVGLLALQASAFDKVSSYPFDVLGAQTEGMGNLLPLAWLAARGAAW
jgi:carbamate kinase